MITAILGLTTVERGSDVPGYGNNGAKITEM